MTTTSDFTIHHDGVTIPVSRGGQGRLLVLVPGMCSTSDSLAELTELLRRDFDVVTFDLRGHGDASPAERYSVDAFRRDLAAVLAELGRPAVLVGYSLGADLAVHHAAEHPEDVEELVLLDGANPLPEPFVAEEDLAAFRAMREEPAGATALTAEQQFCLDLEIDVVRAGHPDRYRRIDRPIRMIMSTAIAGNGTTGRAPRHNRLWRSGVERLVREKPEVSVSWVDADHSLVLTHAPEIAAMIRAC